MNNLYISKQARKLSKISDNLENEIKDIKQDIIKSSSLIKSYRLIDAYSSRVWKLDEIRWTLLEYSEQI